MAGHSPYVVNGGLTYSSRDVGVEAGLFYNVKGPTLSIVGAGLFPDIYIKPFHSLNFSVNKKIGKDQNTAVELKVSNILGSSMETYYQSFQAEDQPNTGFSPGRTFGIGLSHQF